MNHTNTHAHRNTHTHIHVDIHIAVMNYWPLSLKPWPPHLMVWYKYPSRCAMESICPWATWYKHTRNRTRRHKFCQLLPLKFGTTSSGGLFACISRQYIDNNKQKHEVADGLRNASRMLCFLWLGETPVLFLAREKRKKMQNKIQKWHPCHVGFIQFHPSHKKTALPLQVGLHEAEHCSFNQVEGWSKTLQTE